MDSEDQVIRPIAAVSFAVAFILFAPLTILFMLGLMAVDAIGRLFSLKPDAVGQSEGATGEDAVPGR